MTAPESVTATFAPAPNDAHDVERWIISRVAAVAQIEERTIDVKEPFASYGLGSADVIGLTADLSAKLDRPVSPASMFEYPSIRLLAEHLTKITPRAVNDPQTGAINQDPIAVIGLSCRFPGAPSAAAFWELLEEGTDAISEIPPNRWNQYDFYDATNAEDGKAHTRWGGFIDNIDAFDYSYFGISRREAERMDPQQRLLLEVTSEAFDDAGIPADRLAGTDTGVYVGISTQEYSRLQMSILTEVDAFATTGNALSIAANRISYQWNLRGPSMATDSACSSSLVAVHQACAGLRSGESNLAVVGGVNVILSPEISIAFSKAGVMSPDGRCKTFDASANGYVRGEGCGVVVLKRLSDAVNDGDRIRAIIRGSAVNSDGRTNGLVAPSRSAQEAAIRAACRAADVQPGDIQYVEAHGTGTLLGDQIEALALGAVMADGRSLESQRCRVGSVKSNIGHLEAAAGIAGLIKVCLALEHGQIPPTLHYTNPNPHVPFSDLPLTVQARLTDWPDGDRRRIAGVSSFGFGGTNAHVIVQGAPDPKSDWDLSEAETKQQLFVFSAKDQQALRSTARGYEELVEAGRVLDADLSDLAGSLAHRRTHHRHRLAVVASTAQELANQLTAFTSGADGGSPHLTGVVNSRSQGPVVFIYPGHGGQWVGMGRGLLKVSESFRQGIEACDEVFAELLPASVEDLLLRDDDDWLQRVDLVQPAVFAIQVGLTMALTALEIRPDAVVGHSMGEATAAWASGALRLGDAARVVYERSRLLSTIDGAGAMAVAELSTRECQALIAGNDHVAVAASNGPNSTVLAGDEETIVKLVGRLNDHEIFSRRVKVSVASHSEHVDPLEHELVRALADIEPVEGNTAVTSSVYPDGSSARFFDAQYWWDNLRKPVRFMDAIRQTHQDGTVYIELSPTPTLVNDILATTDAMGPHRSANVTWCMRRDELDEFSLLRTVGELYTRGHPLDWNCIIPRNRKPISHPNYPWQRERCWFNSGGLDGRALLVGRTDYPAAREQRPGYADTQGRNRPVTDERKPAMPPATVALKLPESRGPKSMDLDAIIEAVRERVAASVKKLPADIDVNRPLTDVGVESIMAVELKNAFEAEFGIVFPAALLVEGPSINDIAVELRDRIEDR